MHELPESACLACGKKLDAATSMTDDAYPKPGDATICLDCGHLMVFAGDLTLRAPNDAEMYELAGHSKLLQTQNLIAQFHEWRKKNGENAST
jgi:hypothetical protein